MIEIHIFNTQEVEGKYIVSFKYWVRGDCACGAIRKRSTFDRKPTLEEIKKSI